MNVFCLDMAELTATLNDMNELPHSCPRGGTSEKDRNVTFEPRDRSYVFAVVRRIVGRAEDAEDVTQDALVLAYRHRDAFRGASRYRTWLHRIAVTTALGHLRRQRRSRIEDLDVDRERDLRTRAEEGPKSPVDLLSEREDRAEVRRALARLPPRYREVLLERAEASEPEVARRLGISIANVKIRAHRGRRKLREALDQIARTAA